MLTQKQKELLIFIHERMAEGDIAPSFDEMREALHLKSKSGIHRLITALVERGYLERLPHRARALEVKRLPEGYKPGSGSASALPASMPSAAAISAMTSIPVLGRIAAGTPIEAIRHDGQNVDLPPSMMGRGEHYALEVDGDSMVNIGIQDGDTVVIQKCDQAENGAVVVALVDGQEVTLKRIKKEKGKVILIPENNNYEPQIYDEDQVQVQGRLVSLMRSYN